MKPSRGPQQGGQIRFSEGGRPQLGSFAQPIRKYPDQPVVVFSGTGQPDAEGQPAAFCGVSYLDLPLSQPSEEIVANRCVKDGIVDVAVSTDTGCFISRAARNFQEAAVGLR